MILDALDECDEDSRMELAGFFRELVDQAHRPVKIFVSSRPEIEFTEMVKLFSFIQIRTAENMGDIKKYIDAAPEKAVSPPEDHDRIILQRAVKWFKCAQKPLTIKFLLQAVRITFSEKQDTTFVLKIDKETLQESSLTAMCHHLIVMDPLRRLWKFSHASVAEFFESDEHREWISNAEQEIGFPVAEMEKLTMTPEEERLDRRYKAYMDTRYHFKLLRGADVTYTSLKLYILKELVL
nr:uncharacterized protein CTRU02_01279 [Colletotrichum truncatum]KAF6800874.1 hypothetical protein CTRU02_01279 [Colletotrichum truncatum]